MDRILRNDVSELLLRVSVGISMITFMIGLICKEKMHEGSHNSSAKMLRM